jgi:uncharacterized protein (DUF58 family)
MLLVDVSGSSLFGTSKARKKDLITEICAVLAFSAVNNNDKVGLIFFSDRIERYIPPKKGRDQVLHLVRDLLVTEPAHRKTNISEALRFLNNTLRQKTISFLLSDFLDERYEEALRVAGKKHDLIGIKVYDKMDVDLPNAGLIEVEDAETGEVQWVDTGDFMQRSRYHQAFFSMTEFSKSVFLRSGCDLLHLRTDEDYVGILRKFFISRNRPG